MIEVIRSCDKCLRGPRNNTYSKYCANCGDDLVYFVPSLIPDEERMDIIGQNGNDGEHYGKQDFSLKTRIIPVEVHAYDEADNLMFKAKAFDEFTVEVEWKTLIGNSNLEDCIKALRDAVEMMQLEG